MDNIHSRHYPGSTAEDLGRLLDTLGQPDDRLWPNSSGDWPPMRLDGPLEALPRGGHGFIRYTTVHHQPGLSVTCRFDDGVGIIGTHRLDVIDADSRVPGLRHTLSARATGSMRLVWPLALRWLHDAAIEELLDTAEAELGNPPPQRQRSRWVRLLLRVGPTPDDEE